MIYGSVCSGIEAATVAWHPIGWKPAWFAEIERFPSRVLAHRYPHVANLGDFTQIGEDRGPVDVLVGGTPCQSFSIAGKRLGLDDPRGNLALEFLALARRVRARWIVWENVPGVLSSNRGQDFGAFLGALAQLGYGFAYRVLDAQYFGVPQRRRRVFLVAHSGGLWQRAAAVLFERESLSRNPPPGRKAREARQAPNLTAKGAGRDGDFHANGGLAEVADQPQAQTTHSLRAAGCDASEDGTGRGTPLVAATITRRYSNNHTGHAGKDCVPCDGHILTDHQHVAKCMTKGYGQRKDFESETMLGSRLGVRRLTPVECERLQGFPDDYTAIPKAADTPRYAALGNSMAVPVMHWIGQRIALVDQIPI